MVQKHVAFAPASQKQLGSRLRSPVPIGEIAKPVPSKAKESSSLLATTAQPFSRFFHNTSFARIREQSSFFWEIKKGDR